MHPDAEPPHRAPAALMGQVALLAVALAAATNGLATTQLPLWRQFLFILLAAAAYLHGRRFTGRHDWLILAAVAVGCGAVAVVDPAEGGTATAALGVFVAVPWLVGRYRRQQAELVVAGQRRVRQLEHDAELVAERARMLERERIAADMHDWLGHDLALMAVRAGALEVSGSLAEDDAESVAALRASAVEATDRLRTTVGILRDQTAPTHPVHETITDLVARATDAGMSVYLDTDDAPLPDLVGRAVHRIVQETLTNAARYAPRAAVSVSVTSDADTVTVSVRNDQPSRDTTRNDGTGLAGLTERVRLLGGTFHVTRPEDRFTVEARIPLSTPTGGRV